MTDYSTPLQLKNSYVQGTGLDMKQCRIAASGLRRHYLGDTVGTVSITLTDTGSVAETSLKDVWGVQISGNTNSERYGYAQREHDEDSGLVHMRHRMYDPRTGRFTQTDPIWGNRPSEHYVYVTNNPIRARDPMGLEGPFAYPTRLSKWARKFGEKLHRRFKMFNPVARVVESGQDLYDHARGRQPRNATRELNEFNAVLADMAKNPQKHADRALFRIVQPAGPTPEHWANALIIGDDDSTTDLAVEIVDGAAKTLVPLKIRALSRAVVRGKKPGGRGNLSGKGKVSDMERRKLAEGTRKQEDVTRAKADEARLKIGQKTLDSAKAIIERRPDPRTLREYKAVPPKEPDVTLPPYCPTSAKVAHPRAAG